MPLTGRWHSFPFFFLFCMCPLSPLLAYVLKDCTVSYSENITAGVSVDCNECDLVSIPDDIPREAISLWLWNNDIKRIDRKVFYNLSKLRLLDLEQNSLTDEGLGDGAFFHLVELKVLTMDMNNLKTLTANVFQGLSNLLIMHLRQCGIQFIHPAAFQSLHSLQSLNLMHNELHKITDIITILQLPHLQVLNVSVETFQTKDLPSNMSSVLKMLNIEDFSFRNFSITTAVFPHLKTIILTVSDDFANGCEWDIPDKYFLRNITKVYFSLPDCMSFNTIKNALQSLDSLEYLRLESIYWGIKHGLLNTVCKIPTLRTLSLERNYYLANISQLTPCTQLTNLDLYFNNLTELSMDPLKEMKQLTYLNLAVNRLSKVPDQVKCLSMLQILILRQNYIAGLSCLDFFNLTRLTHLHLDQNFISELNECVFQHLTELKVLTVSNNLIWTFHKTFKIGLQKLELLDLNKNVVKTLSKGDFTSLKSLKHLHMELGNLMEWDGTYFEGLDELETLSLIYNVNPLKMTSSPPHELPFLKSLKSLTIQFIGQSFNLSDFLSCMFFDMNNLEHFTAENVYSGLLDRGTFKYVPELKSLTLKSNNLPYLHPDIFDPIPNLEFLDLSNNELESLDFLAQANLTRLSWLDLSQNELTVINVSVFKLLPALRYIDMGDNPFACDCSNSDFLQWMLNNNQTQVAPAHRYMCGYPLSKKGTRFLDFDIHSCWMDASFVCFVSSTCAILLTLLTSFTYHALRLHLLYAYYLFLAFLYDAKERKRGSPQRYDAFISYNVHDELWVYREMLPVLEGEQGWRLCLHHRDFLPGKPIMENITEAIYGSRKTICVISHHYLESEWCSREIQMASYRLFDEKKDVLTLVFLEDIPAQQLSPYYQLRRLVKRQTYLSWTQARQHPGLFWQNLRRALETPDTDLCLNE